jgi:hypothetical protein
MATVPTDPETPRLFEVRSKLMESACAEEAQSTKSKAEVAGADFATETCMRRLPVQKSTALCELCTRRADQSEIQEMKVLALL